MKKTTLALSLIAASLMASTASFASNSISKYYLTADDAKHQSAATIYTDWTRSVYKDNFKTLTGDIDKDSRSGALQAVHQLATQNRLRTSLLGNMHYVYKNLDHQEILKTEDISWNGASEKEFEFVCENRYAIFPYSPDCAAIRAALVDSNIIKNKIGKKEKIVKTDFSNAAFKTTDPDVFGKYYLSADDSMQSKAAKLYTGELQDIYVTLPKTENVPLSLVVTQASLQGELRSKLLGELQAVYKNLDKQGNIKPITYEVSMKELKTACHSDNNQLNSSASCSAIFGAINDIERINAKISAKQKIEKSDFAHALFEIPALSK